MKNAILFISILTLVGCNNISNTSTVCNCFFEAKNDTEKRLHCYKLQNKIAATKIGFDKNEFISSTDKCGACK